MFHLLGEGPFAFVLDYLFMFFFVHFGLFFLFTLGPPHHSYDTSFPHSLKKHQGHRKISSGSPYDTVFKRFNFI